MSRTVRVQVKHYIDFEIPDGDLTEFDRQQLLALSKKALLQIPASSIMNDAKYKIKEAV